MDFRLQPMKILSILRYVVVIIQILPRDPSLLFRITKNIYNFNNLKLKTMKTKIFFLALAVLFTANPLFSQDLIIKNDKSEIKAKILEIQENSIKYKLPDFLEGPLRSISLSEVFMVIYENGRRETFNSVDETPVMPVQENMENISVEPSYIQETSNTSYYPLRLFLRFSIQDWTNSGLSEIFGNNPLFGAGIEKQVSEDFKFGADFDFASTKEYEVTINYTQFGVFMKYSWYPFGSNRPNVCGGLGIKGVSLRLIEDSYSEKASSVGFSALLGVEIPLGRKVILDLGWNTVWAKADFEGSKINLGSNIFSGGFIFNLW
jgi:hypothetical protein